MTRPTLTLACIMKNEEENLPRLFKSIEGCFDEIICTDTGSTDDSVAVAKRLGAKIQTFNWCNDFSAARNASFEPVKTEFVMWLDLDDELEGAEGFKLWRDNVMGLADYWLAPYHYSSDDQGKATCSFVRERVFRVNKGLRWKYFLHEGVTPQSPYGQVKAQLTKSWAVRHKRTEEDVRKDRSRNLNIFEAQESMGRKLDPRMQYYYGKELFENGRAKESIEAFGKALSDKSLEMHDRILGMQYLCFAFLVENQFHKVIELANQGTILAPNRAEFHCLIGDAFLKMGRVSDAVPFFHAAKGCVTQGHDGTSPVFHHEPSYTHYPMNMLTRAYVHMGDLDQSEAMALDAFNKHSNPESKILLEEVQKMKVRIFGYKDAKKCEDIVISCPAQSPYEWDAEIAQTKSMGGSETAAIEMAQWLHQLSGRTVKIFNMREKDKTVNGVEYISAQKVHEYFNQNEPWLHISWRHAFKLTNAPTFLWCHDLYTPGGENHMVYDKILALTPFHKRFLMSTQQIPEEKIHITRNGIIPERFKDGPWEKEPFRFVYGSSPDRGLDRAMRVLDKVREKYPEITLHIHYGWEHLDKYGLKDLRVKLEQMVSERKSWVTYHGATQQEELMKSYKKSSYCVQPSDFIETSMISAVELLACGVYPIMREVGGVADTLRIASESGMATLVDSDCITESEYTLYAEKVIQALDEKRVQHVKINPDELSWESVAKSWLATLPDLAAMRKNG